MAEKPMVDGSRSPVMPSRVDGAVLEVAAQRVGDDLAHLERGARGCVDLVAVVRLDDLDVVAGRHGLGRHFEQLEGDVDAHAHVGRHHDRDVLGDLGDLGLLRVAEAGGADDGLHAQLAADREVRERALGASEVDEHLRVLQACAQVGHDGHAAVETQEGAGIGAQGRAADDVEGAGQAQVGRIAHGLDQHVAHAARSPGDGNAARRGGGIGRGSGGGFGHADSVSLRGFRNGPRRSGTAGNMDRHEKDGRLASRLGGLPVAADAPASAQRAASSGG